MEAGRGPLCRRGKLARVAGKVRRAVARLAPGLGPLAREACLLGCGGRRGREEEALSKLDWGDGVMYSWLSHALLASWSICLTR
jgi:hypothetical protein